ncbi:hypothetical protein PHLGIDRAFT_413580 [Phlebiopsis gigantea 11061_1 CR5-6]|uniref:F-box domain-containing protein n=1 Tax=Phlebiopsis gigantea (strain 11061_1 CR5-6) TaxID=745531 RepID=A0A0C3RZ73_PHLG1|nr:hypothetical protein PHLGIDRAFT_413580 [Phlebiopsis gigantea 11061_1 CR5-6]
MAPRIPFPPELNDMIIGYLHDDNASLLSCALVCKAWLPAARLHLYTQVQLIDPADKPWSAFIETLRASPATRLLCKGITFTLLRKTSPLKAAADILTLLPDLERLEWSYAVEDLSSAEGHVGIRFFAKALSSLNALHYLCSNGSNLGEQSSISDVPPTAPGLRSLVTLKLWNNNFEVRQPDRFNYWLCLAIAEAKKDTTHPQFKHLKELLFSIGHDDILDDLKHMGAVMSVVAPHLQTLTFFWEYIADFYLEQEHLVNSGLSLCTSLEKLNFSLIYPSVYAFRHSADYLALLPRSAPIRHLTLSIAYYLYDAVESPGSDEELRMDAANALHRDNYPEGIARLDAAICDLPHLQEVTIELAHSWMEGDESSEDGEADTCYAEFARWIRPRFPCVEAKANLKVRWECDS